MLKLLMIFFSSMFMSLALLSQKINSAHLPAAVKSEFARQFPGKTAHWEMEQTNYEANFIQDGKQMSAIFQPNGVTIETETVISIKELPEAAQSYLRTHYRKSVVREADRIKKADGEINYEAEVNHRDVIFDDKGQFIKEAVD